MSDSKITESVKVLPTCTGQTSQSSYFRAAGVCWSLSSSHRVKARWHLGQATSSWQGKPNQTFQHQHISMGHSRKMEQFILPGLLGYISKMKTVERPCCSSNSSTPPLPLYGSSSVGYCSKFVLLPPTGWNCTYFLTEKKAQTAFSQSTLVLTSISLFDFQCIFSFFQLFSSQL